MSKHFTLDYNAALRCCGWPGSWSFWVLLGCWLGLVFESRCGWRGFGVDAVIDVTCGVIASRIPVEGLFWTGVCGGL